MKGLEIKGRLDRIGKTPLEHFQDIKGFEVADGLGITVEDLLPGKCEKVWKSLKALEIIKEKRINVYFISTINTYDEYLNADAHFQPNVVDYMGNYHKEQVLTKEEFDLLKEVLEC